MKKALALLLAFAMIFVLSACDKQKEDPTLGVYEGVSVFMFDEETPMSDVYEGDSRIELKKDGKCVFTLDGDVLSCDWTLDGEALTITIEGEACSGTLKDGEIMLDFFGMMDMKFVKGDASANESKATTKKGGLLDKNENKTDKNNPFDKFADRIISSTAAASPIGYFEAYEMESEGDTYDREMLDMMELSDYLYVILAEDGTGRLALGDEETAITWDENAFYANGERLPYLFEETYITIELDELKFVFVRSENEPPALKIPGAFPNAFAADNGGDWHGMMEIYDASGSFADIVGMQMEVIARFIFHEDGSCTPYIAAALSGDSGTNFADLSVTYNEFGDLMILEGSFIDKPITENSNIYAMDDVLRMDIYVDDSNGDSMNLIASLRRLDETWDYDYDYPALPEGAVDFYMGKSFMEIVELFKLDANEVPEYPEDIFTEGAPIDSGSSGATENPGFTGPTASFDYAGKGMVLFDYPSDDFYYEKKFGVESIRANDESIKISFVADWDMEEYTISMEGYQVHVDESGGVIEEGLSYGGYEATRVTWEDVIGTRYLETYIFFAPNDTDYVGVNVIVTADSQSLIDDNMDAIEAILHSVRLG